MGSKLPPLTQMLMDISRWVKFPGWIFIVASPMGIWFLLKLIRLSPTGRVILDRVKLMVPIFGQIVSKTSVERFRSWRP